MNKYYIDRIREYMVDCVHTICVVTKDQVYYTVFWSIIVMYCLRYTHVHGLRCTHMYGVPYTHVYSSYTDTRCIIY